MSRENAELWRETVEGFLGGSAESDWEPWLTSVAEILDPAIEWDASKVAIPVSRASIRAYPPPQFRFQGDELAALYLRLQLGCELPDCGRVGSPEAAC